MAEVKQMQNPPQDNLSTCTTIAKSADECPRVNTLRYSYAHLARAELALGLSLGEFWLYIG